MGPKESKRQSDDLGLTKNSFEFQYVIGKGGFGKVWKVVFKRNRRLYALKEMSKAKIVEKKSQNSVRYERELLSKIRHPFIVNMIFCFQDIENLYLVMDLLTGGDLRYHISRHKRFNEEQTKFFVACVVLALDYVHSNNILHRDIKPENLVLEDTGYVRLTDFGIAKMYHKDNGSETSGTPGYMSPEVMCAQNHTMAVDYFALGVMTYEFMLGRRPYVGRTRKEIKEHIMSKQVHIAKLEMPDDWSPDAADFANKLLQRKPVNRLGFKGAQEVKDHPWLKNYPWKDLYEKKISPKFIPKTGDNFDQKYCQAPDKIGEETRQNYENLIMRETVQDLFRKFTYVAEEEQKKQPRPSQLRSVKPPPKKFTNPHLNLSSSMESTTKMSQRGGGGVGSENLLPAINPQRLFKQRLMHGSQSSPNLVVKVMKNSNSMMNFNYVKRKPTNGLTSYYFQN